MKLYVKNYSSFVSSDENIDIKKILKQKYKLDTRRQDAFIHLGLYGGQLLKEKTTINADDELYVTSGIGNVDVVQKTNTRVYEEKKALKLFDFINLLGNTTSYYIASSLGMNGKNIFQISDNFTYINTLISLYASIRKSQKNAIICSIDLVSSPDEVIKRVLGVAMDCEVVSSVNYQKLSLHNDGAIAELDFETSSYSLDEIKAMVDTSDEKVIISPRCSVPFFETYASYAVNEAIQKSEDLIYIDYCQERYKILKVKSLR